MTEEGTVDDRDPRTAPKPQPSDKPQGEPRDFPHVAGPEDEDEQKVKDASPPKYTPGENPYERDEP